MKLPKIKIFRYSFLLFISAVLLSAFISKKPSFDSIREGIFDQYIRNLTNVQSAASGLHSKVLNLKTEDEISELKKDLQETRFYWKKAEFLAEYLDQEFCKDYINGPPLPHLERNAGTPIVLNPEGLQVLEELIYGEEVLQQKEELIYLTQRLKEKTAILLKHQQAAKIYHRNVFEAGRAQLVRIFSLGLTGFDTPGSESGINDARVSMETLKETFDPYLVWVKDKNRKLAERVEKTFLQAINYLQRNQDFETFDRADFLISFINPLYSDLLQIHKLLQIETRNEVENSRQPVNYMADKIFSGDFLDPYYFTTLSEKVNTTEIGELGKLLFFDPILSGNNKRACASCHNPQKAFTDGMKKSLAFDFEGTVDRNSPTLINAVFADRYFYDMRALKLEDQVEHVMVDDREFHFSFNAAVEKLSTSREYNDKFNQAFDWYKSRKISRETITVALAAYIQSLVALNSPFDKYARGENEEIDLAVKRGFNLFMGKAACGTCHFAPTFSGLIPPQYKENESEVLGVPSTKDTLNPALDPDLGRAANKRLLERSSIFNHAFKTPTLRNVELTAPYMHNGVFDTLEEVMDFYNRGGGHGLGLNVPNQTLSGDPLNLSKQEIGDLIAFMKSLTDTAGVTSAPGKLPLFPEKILDKRMVGGEY